MFYWTTSSIWSNSNTCINTDTDTVYFVCACNKFQLNQREYNQTVAIIIGVPYHLAESWSSERCNKFWS